MQVLNCGVYGVREVFMQGEAWENMAVGEETDDSALANTACVRTPDVKTEAVFWGASDVPSI